MLDLFNQPAYQLTEPFNQHTGNQEILDDNREHYSQQAKLVLEHLLRGEWVNGRQMNRLHQIQDIRPRIAAIKKYYVLEERKIEGGHGSKEWKIVSKKSEYTPPYIERNVADEYQGLFNLLSKEHNLILTISEMDEIIREAQKVKSKSISNDNTTRKAL